MANVTIPGTSWDMPGYIGEGKTFGTVNDFSNWVDSTPKDTVQQTVKDFGVNTADFAALYNAGAGTTWNANDAYTWLGNGGTSGTNGANGALTVTSPGFVDNQAGINASIPGYFDDLMAGIPKYNAAYANLARLPQMIDDWTDESLKRQRVTGDMATGVFNQVANQRAGSGTMGGTENQNLEANAQARLSQIILENQNNIQNQANQLKAGTYQNMPSAALMPVNAGLGLYGTSANEAANWGNIAMQTLLGGY